MLDKPTSAKTAFTRTIDLLGGQTTTAQRLTEVLGKRVSQQWVWTVLNRNQAVPAEWCLPLEQATGGKITRHDLRPDIYPREDAA